MKPIPQEYALLIRKITTAITNERINQGLSQRELATKSGLCYTTIAKVESLEANCYSLPNIIRLCKALNTKPSEIFSRVNL